MQALLIPSRRQKFNMFVWEVTLLQNLHAISNLLKLPDEPNHRSSHDNVEAQRLEGLRRACTCHS